MGMSSAPQELKKRPLASENLTQELELRLALGQRELLGTLAVRIGEEIDNTTRRRQFGPTIQVGKSNEPI